MTAIAVAQLDRLVDVVGDEHDRLARARACRRRNSFWRRSRSIGSTAPNGSSMSMQRRVGGQRARHADALALAAGELRRVAVASSCVEPDSSSSSSTRARDAVACPSRAAAGRWRCSRRPCGAGTGRPAGSRSRCRAAARRWSRSRTERPSSRMSPLVELDHAVDQPHRGRLAAARRADEDADLARRGPRRRGRGSAGSPAPG